MNLRDTIKETTRKHLQEEKLLGQCITAVGWVNGTVPDMDNIIELPCTDVSASGIAAGMALAGARPMLIIRFQDFLILNASSIVNFAAKQKLWGKTCPVFIRALSQEGKGTGATHSAKLHSVFMHFPGLRVCSPITSLEWAMCYEDFMDHDDPMLCCEYKGTFDNQMEYEDHYNIFSDITLIGIGNARQKMVDAAHALREQGIECDTFHIHKLKPLVYNIDLEHTLRFTRRGLVIDCGFDICGAGSWIAQKLGERTGVVVHSMGLEDASCAVSEKRENVTPSVEKIMRKVWSML
jgi:pyruvate/2-oxoglutarate/acetoin dehydrogenase E1 component